MITKQLSADYTLMEGEASGQITVRASSFGNEDVYGDIFEKGAFDADIKSVSKTNKLPMLWQHRSDDPIGNWYKLWKDGDYLFMEGQLTLGVPQADRAHLNLKAGDVKGVSIGFNSIEAVERRDAKGGYEGMNFKKVALMENSIVTFPANPMAGVDSVKSLPAEQREFRKLLIDIARDADIDISRRDVEKIVNGIWPSLSNSITAERDAGSDDQLAALINAAADKFKPL